MQDQLKLEEGSRFILDFTGNGKLQNVIALPPSTLMALSFST